MTMTKEQLQEAVGFMFKDKSALGLELYLVMQGKEGLELRQADLGDDGLETEILKGFADHLEWRTVSDEEAKLRPLSELDQAKNTIHLYDLEGLPDGLGMINAELDKSKVPLYDFTTDRLQDVRAFLIKIASPTQQVVLYKHHHHLNVLSQSSTFYFFGDDHRFKKPEGELLRFSFAVDFALVNGKLLVYDIECLEKKFGFESILVSNAGKQVTVIAALGFVENIDELQDYAKDKAGAKEILRLNKNSPVLKLEFDQIKTFILGNAYLRRRLRFNDDESQLRFHTHVSKRYFIQLLNDDFLTSHLSKTEYASSKKDGIAELDNVTPVE
jgi:Domain of unknown function (DUF4868)